MSVWDLFWAAASPVFALYLRNPELVLSPKWDVLGWYWSLSSGFALVAFFAFRLQNGMTRYFSLQEAIDVAEAVLFSELMTFLALFTLTRLDGIPRSTPLTHGLMLFAGLIAARLIIRIVFSQTDEAAALYRSRPERIIVIGANPLASAYIRLLEAFSPHQSVIAILDGSPEIIGKSVGGVRVMGGPSELDAILSEFAVHGVGVDRVVVAGEANLFSPTVVEGMQRICSSRKLPFWFLPRILGISEAAGPGLPSMPLTQPIYPAASGYFMAKRLIDVVGALTLIVLLTPLFVIAGFLVFLDIGRPLLFWQERLGWKGRPFLIYKFRTLRAPNAGEASQQSREPTFVGRLLRSTRLDELPQLFNVLVGDMSLIGPRPLLPQDQPANVAIRLSVRPGITGWAQINGGKLLTPQQKEKLDEWYVRSASLGVDIRIALLTLLQVMKTRMSSTEAIADTEQAKSKKIEVPHTFDAPSLTSNTPGGPLSRLHS
jgi:lipopolysaccharide/colanic/teichoic acid biosynthesis glycosyltransferase